MKKYLALILTAAVIAAPSYGAGQNQVSSVTYVNWDKKYVIEALKSMDGHVTGSVQIGQDTPCWINEAITLLERSIQPTLVSLSITIE